MGLAFSRLFPEERDGLLSDIAQSLGSGEERDVIDALNAVGLPFNDGFGNLLSTEELSLVLREVSNIIRWRHKAGLVNALESMRWFVQKRPDAFSADIAVLVQTGLAELAHETDPMKCLDKASITEALDVRKPAASLAFEIFKYYSEKQRPIPFEVEGWRDICASENEFAEIRNQWELPEAALTLEAQTNGK
jgi:hypothetical protein